MEAVADARYAAMRWNTPLGEAHAARLLDGLALDRAGSVLDLGCGWGELLLRAVARGAYGCRGIGVDDAPALLARGERAARAQGLGGSLRFCEGDAAAWTGSADVVLCVGAAHAFGGTRAALHALRDRLEPGGRLLFGDGCWPTPPTAPALEIFGEDVPGYDALLGAAGEAGYVQLAPPSLASLEEWDEFEAAFRAGRERWASEHPDDPQAAEVAEEMAARRAEYESDYRGVLGFAYLTLSLPAADRAP